MNRKLGKATATAAILAILAVLPACASKEEAEAGGNGAAIKLDPKLIDAAEKKAEQIAGGKKIGGSIEIINENGGREGNILKAAFAPFTAATGVEIRFTGTTDYNNVLASRLKAGNPPDIGSNALGAIKQYHESHPIMNLSEVIGDDTLRENFSQSTLDTGSIDGDVYTVYQGFNNYQLWYNPETYDGPKSGTWQDIEKWTQQTAATGSAPWCKAEEAGPATGAVGAQWIEILFIKKYGPEKAMEWATGKLPWTSPEVKDAFEMFGAIAGKDANVNGGVAGSLSESFATGASGLVADPAKCRAVMWGSWTPALIDASSAGVEPGENLDFMQIPASNPAYANAEAFSANGLFAFNDTPTTRAFMEYIASTEEQTLLASANNWVVSNVNVPVTTYSSPLLQKIAQTYFAPGVRLVGSPDNLAPAGVNTTMWQEVVAYLQDPSKLDSALQRIQEAQDAATS